MTDWVMRTLASTGRRPTRLRAQYWRDYGTTLAGLMDGTASTLAPYLHEVHEISLEHLDPDPDLADRIRALPGRRIVYTNGSKPYAERVLAARGLSGAFDAVYGVEHAGFRPKPERAAFETIFAADGTEAAKCRDVRGRHPQPRRPARHGACAPCTSPPNPIRSHMCTTTPTT